MTKSLPFYYPKLLSFFILQSQKYFHVLTDFVLCFKFFPKVTSLPVFLVTFLFHFPLLSVVGSRSDFNAFRIQWFSSVFERVQPKCQLVGIPWLGVWQGMQTILECFMFCWPCISIHLCNKNQIDAIFILSLFRQFVLLADSQLKSTTHTNCCTSLYTVYLLMMGYKYVWNM
jgi:hypothetical protein